MNKLPRLVGTAVLVLVVIRVASWLLSPALPVLIEILVIGLGRLRTLGRRKES